MLKKIVVWFLSIVFVLCSVIIPDFSSFADNNDVYYLYNVIDFSNLNESDYNTTYQNYLLYYDDAEGYLLTDIDKSTDVNNFTGSNFSTKFTNNNLLSKWVKSSHDDYTPDINISNVNFKGIVSPDIVVNGQVLDRSKYKTVIATDGGANMPSSTYIIVCSLYVPDDTTCFLEQGRIMCNKNDVYYAYNIYTIGFESDDYLSFNLWQSTSSGSNSYYTTYDFNSDNQADLYQYYVTLNGWLYSDIPVYYMYQNNSNGQGSFLNESPYNYGDYNGRGQYNSVAKYVLSGLDDTGFVIDRRPDGQINNGNQGGQVNSNIGVVDASFSTLFGGKSFEDQILLVAYQLNQYTRNINNEVDLKLNYRFYCSGQYDNNPFLFDGNYYDSNGYYDSYKINNTSLTAIDCKKVYDNIYGSDLIGSDYGLGIIWQIANHVSNGKNMYSVNQFVGSLMSIGGFSLSRRNQDFSTSGEGKNFWNNIETAFNDSFNFVDEYVYKTGLYESTIQFNYDNSRSAVFNDAFIEFTMFIEDTTTHDTSNTYVIRYNYLDGSVQETGGFVSGDDVFTGDYTYSNTGVSTNRNSDNGYGSSAYNGGSSASIGDITITTGLDTIPYILVDIPENDWINKTPNLKNMLEDFKTMLAETKEGSILTLLPSTYAYLPTPVWNYILYAVGIGVMIGIWRAITRR